MTTRRTLKRKYLRFEDFQSRIHDTWYWTKQHHWDHLKHISYINEQVWNHADFKRLTRYEQGYLHGMNGVFWNQVANAMQWRFDVGDGTLHTFDSWREAYPTLSAQTLENKGHHYWPNTTIRW